MGVVEKFGRGVLLAAALAVGMASSATAQTTDTAATVAELTIIIESLRSGDDVAYDAAEARLEADGHWLPPAGWRAIEAKDLDQLTFVWLLLDAPGDETLTWAFDQILFERELVAAEIDGFGADPFLLDVVDADGETILQVIDHKRIGISPEARAVLSPIGTNGAEAPGLDTYEQVLAMMNGRLTDAGYVLPAIADLDLDSALAPLPRPGGPIDTAGGPVPTPRPNGVDAPTPTVTDGATTDAIVTPTDDGTSGADDAASTEFATPPASATPTTPDTTAAPDPTPANADDGIDPMAIVMGVATFLALALAAVALRRNRHTDRLADIAFTDALTGLANRRRLDTDVADEMKRGDRPTSVLMIDVDHFKAFNDVHGHATGDDVLRRVAAIIARNVRADDLPYRYGGEEFSVLLPDTGPDEASAVGERIRVAVERARVEVAGGADVSVTASLGLSSGPAEQVSHLIQRADQALYVAKDKGRNQLARG